MLQLHRTQFRNQKQRHGKNLQQFSAGISRLAAIDDDVLETMAVYVFEVGDTEL